MKELPPADRELNSLPSQIQEVKFNRLDLEKRMLCRQTEQY